MNDSDEVFLDWLDFVFDERWAHGLQNEDEYLDREDLGIDIDDFVRDCIRLFRNPDILVGRFNPAQLDSGFFSFILSPRMELCWWIWDRNSDADLRRDFILSSVTVFERVFTKVVTQHSCFMWWDALRDFSDDPDSRTADWMFEALSQILAIESDDCRESALHGLGHLRHRGKRKLIEGFLRQNPGCDCRDYALAAIEGRVL